MKKYYLDFCNASFLSRNICPKNIKRLMTQLLDIQVMAAVPFLSSPFMGASLVFMIVYVWGREFPNARINIYGLVSLKVMLAELNTDFVLIMLLA